MEANLKLTTVRTQHNVIYQKWKEHHMTAMHKNAADTRAIEGRILFLAHGHILHFTSGYQTS